MFRAQPQFAGLHFLRIYNNFIPLKWNYAKQYWRKEIRRGHRETARARDANICPLSNFTDRSAVPYVYHTTALFCFCTMLVCERTQRLLCAIFVIGFGILHTFIYTSVAKQMRVEDNYCVFFLCCSLAKQIVHSVHISYIHGQEENNLYGIQQRSAAAAAAVVHQQHFGNK